MKILSKYKDYYDYLQGIRGMDEKVILDRTKGQSLNYKLLKDGDKHTFIICGNRYEIFYFDGKYYTNAQLVSLGKQAVQKSGYLSGYEIIDLTPEREKRFKEWGFDRQKENYSHIKCPIVKIKGNYGDYIEFPKLSEFNFGSIISAEEIWDQIYNWQCQVPEHKSNQTNSDKIVSHGFDLRESFRPKIK